VNSLLSYLRSAFGAEKELRQLRQRLEDLQLAVGRIELRQMLSAAAGRATDLQSHEFKVSSQWGEDGIIQFLIHTIEIRNRSFVEFGVEDYTEANTRFLLQNDNWSGLVIDGSEEHVRAIRHHPLSWRYNLKADCAFIDRENINAVILRNGVAGEIGLLSVDIDGNDYWVWEAIDCIQPAIVVCEYNGLFGHRHAVTIPYDKKFHRATAHPSMLYAGASIAALDHLGQRKGYSLVGSNSAGNNAFFVRTDRLGGLRPLTPAEAFVRLQCRDSRDREGHLSFLGYEESQQAIADLPLYDVVGKRTISVRDLLA